MVLVWPFDISIGHTLASNAGMNHRFQAATLLGKLGNFVTHDQLTHCRFGQFPEQFHWAKNFLSLPGHIVLSSDEFALLLVAQRLSKPINAFYHEQWLLL